MNATKRVLVLALAGVMVTQTAGWSKKNVKSGNLTEDSEIGISADIVDKKVETALYESLYDENIDCKLAINTYVNSLYDINMSDEERDSLKNDYLRGMYTYCIKNGADIEKIIQELNTMLKMSQHQTCVSTELWDKSFVNLINLFGEYPSLFEVCLPFAEYVNNSVNNLEQEAVL